MRRSAVSWSGWLDAGRLLSFVYNDTELMVGKDVKPEKINSNDHERSILVARIRLCDELRFVTPVKNVNIERSTSDVAEDRLSQHE